jgi:riboflavin synthase
MGRWRRKCPCVMQKSASKGLQEISGAGVGEAGGVGGKELGPGNVLVAMTTGCSVICVGVHETRSRTRMSGNILFIEMARARRRSRNMETLFESVERLPGKAKMPAAAD